MIRSGARHELNIGHTNPSHGIRYQSALSLDAKSMTQHELPQFPRPKGASAPCSMNRQAACIHPHSPPSRKGKTRAQRDLVATARLPARHRRALATHLPPLGPARLKLSAHPCKRNTGMHRCPVTALTEKLHRPPPRRNRLSTNKLQKHPARRSPRSPFDSRRAAAILGHV